MRTGRGESDPRLRKAFALCRGLSALDVARREGLELKQRGSSWWCRCPLHAEKTASFRISNDLWHCFGCKAGGDALGLYAALHRLDRAEAALELAGLAPSMPHRVPRPLPPRRPAFLAEADADGFTWDRLCRIRARAAEDLGELEEKARADALGEAAADPAAERFWRALAVRAEADQRLDGLHQAETMWNDAAEAAARAKWRRG